MEENMAKYATYSSSDVDQILKGSAALDRMRDEIEIVLNILASFVTKGGIEKSHEFEVEWFQIPGRPLYRIQFHGGPFWRVSWVNEEKNFIRPFNEIPSACLIVAHTNLPKVVNAIAKKYPDQAPAFHAFIGKFLSAASYVADLER